MLVAKSAKNASRFLRAGRRRGQHKEVAGDLVEFEHSLRSARTFMGLCFQIHFERPLWEKEKRTAGKPRAGTLKSTHGRSVCDSALAWPGLRLRAGDTKEHRGFRWMVPDFWYARLTL